MTTSRYNFYTIIHKGIRHELGELLRLGAGTDFAGPEAAAYVARLRASIRLMNEHALHEDHHVEPLLERFAPPLARRVAATHRVLEAHEHEVLRLCEAALGSPADGHALYLALTRYAATQYGHMAEEESDVIEALWERMSDDQIMGVEHAIVSGIAPEDNATYMAWMIHGISDPEREAFIGAMRQGAPAEVVAYAEALASSARQTRLAA